MTFDIAMRFYLSGEDTYDTGVNIPNNGNVM